MAINRTDFEQLMNQARVKLVGASDAGLKAELYDVLTDFFNDSSCWTQIVTVPYIANQRDYPVFVPEGQIIRLNGVSDWGTIVPIPPGSLIPAGTPAPLFVPALMPYIGLLSVKNIPNSAGYYQAEFVTNVALPTDKHMMPSAPDWVLPLWHTAILDGILGKMMTSPNKTYSSEKQGVYHLKRFRDGIARARITKLKANTVGAQAWRFPQQFRSISQQSGVPSIGNASERMF